jgi:hypothetical protein
MMMNTQRHLLRVLGFTLIAGSSHLSSQAALKPGVEPCGRATLHASEAVRQAKKFLTAALQNGDTNSQSAIPGALEESNLTKALIEATDFVMRCEAPDVTAEHLGVFIA